MISTDPEFTWNGTMFIVLGFTFWGTAQGVATAVRGATRRRWKVTVARGVGFVCTLPLFFAAGAIMAPTVVGGSLARYRTDWVRWARGVLALVAVAPFVLVGLQLHDEWNWGWRWFAGMAGLVAVYAVVVAAERATMSPQPDGWRLPTFVRAAAVLVAVLAVVVPTVGVGLLR